MWERQTDEDEMGIEYNKLDAYICCGEGSEELKNKVEQTKLRNMHKTKGLFQI